MKKRLLSVITALALCLSLLPTAALAAESDGLCEHHTEHTAECGYVEGETPCGFVCGQCAGEDTVTVLTDWDWVDDWEIIDADSGNVLLPFASEDDVAYFEDIVERLPVSVLASGEELTLGNWLCPDYPEEGAYEGEYIFETTLPEGYALSDGGSTLKLTVALGDPEGEPVAMLTVSMKEPPEGQHTIGGTTVYAYELSTAAHLYWFANQINTTQQDISAVLTTDITVNQSVLNASGGLNSGSFEAWTPIGTVDHNFRGKFDGQGHTISGLYLNDSRTGNVGLFGVVGSPANIYRVGVVDSYFAGNQNVGGLCGRASSEEIRIESCFTTATVSGTSHVGTFCGFSSANINNCYSAGKVGNSYGKFTGNEDKVDFCYALSDTDRDGTKDSDLKYRTMDAFKSGEVTYGLTKNQATPSWRQTIGKHTFPQCTTDGDIVYCGKKEGDVYYHNHSGSERCPYCSVPDFNNNAYLIYTTDELYWFAEYVNGGHPDANAQVRNDITVGNDWVPIGDEGNAFTGRFSHPADQKTISGIPEDSSLFGPTGSGAEIARITVTSGGLCADNGGKIVDCHVSGGGMLVSGTNSGTVSDSSAAGGALVKDNSGAITNCQVSDGGTLVSGTNSGAVSDSSAADGTLVQNNSGTITGCHAEGSGATLCATNNTGGTVTDCSVTGTGSAVLVGANSGTIQKSYAADGATLCTTNSSGGKIINCYATGTGSVTLCGSNSGVIANCFAAGGSGTTVGSGGTITNCYALADSTASTTGGTTLTTASPFASGEVAYRLDQGTAAHPGGVWGQDISTDTLPVFDGKAVYYKQGGNPEYHNHNGYCDICTITPKYQDDQWQITNVDELYWYAQYISGTLDEIPDRTKNAILVNNITVNPNVLKADGTLSEAYDSFTVWTPIMATSNYTGTFDGNHHTISGLYVNAPGTSYVGFFGKKSGGTVKNLTIADSYFEGTSFVGGICGLDQGNVSGCTNTGTVKGKETYVGGICGYNGGTVSGCTNSGAVTGGVNAVGGICGHASQAKVTGCVNIGTVTGGLYNTGGICGNAYKADVSGCTNSGAVTGSYCVGGVCGICDETTTVSGCSNSGAVSGSTSVGGVCGENKGSVKNCYYNSEVHSGDAVGRNDSGTVNSVLGKTTKEFASGEVAYLLNGSTSTGTLAWKQNIDNGTPDAVPQFTGGTVYKTTSASPCPGYTNHSNGIKQHKYENYVCTWCGDEDTIPVTVSGITAKEKIYDGTTTATLDFSGVTLSGVEENDNVAVTATGSIGDKNVGEDKIVTITGLTLTGTNAGKYRLANSGQQTTATASITPKSVTATVTVTDKTYDGDTDATVSAAVTTTEGLIDGDTITIEGLTGTFEDANVGTGKAVTINAENKSITGDDASNYAVTIPTTATGTISQSTNTWITKPSIEGWTYGESAKTPDGAAKFGTVTVEYKVKDAEDATYAAAVPTNAGDYTVRFTVEGTDNYTSLTETKELTITPRTIGIQWGSITFTYNGSEQCPTATATELVGEDTCAINVTGGQTDAGDHTATATVVDNPNYKLPENNTTTFTISPKVLTADDLEKTGGSITKTYDGNTTAAGITVGVKSASLMRDSDVVTVTGTAAYNSANVSEASQIVFTPNAITTGNYTLASTETLTIPGASITKKDISISAATISDKPYDGSANAAVTAVTFDGAVDTLTKGTDYEVTSAVFPDADADADNVNVTLNVALKGTAAGNYNLTNGAGYVAASAAKITKIAWSNKTATGSAMYGNPGTVDLSNYLADGYVIGAITNTNGDIFTGAPGMDGTALTFSFANVPGNVGQTAVITVPVTGATNYDPYSIAVTVTVEAKTVPTVTAPTAAAALIYSGEAQTLISAGTTTGGEMQYSLTSGTGYSTELPTAVNAGDYTVYYKVVGSNDYADVAENSLTVTIGKKEVTATPKDVTITRGSAIPVFELTYTGLLGEDTLTPSADPTFTCFEADGTTAVSTRTEAGTYTITWANTDIFDDETNYRVVATPGTLTINNPSHSGGGSSTPSYSVTVHKTENGTITVSPKSASRGGTVTITPKPKAGYTVEQILVTDKNGNPVKVTDNGDGTYSFTQPAGKVNVKVTFMEDNSMLNFFVDVFPGDYYYDAVLWAAENGITGGVDDTHFAPNTPCTRAQIVTFLWRAAGSPEPKSSTMPFMDVSADSYYAKAVAWAVENGITSGTSDTTFSPDSPCTRAQSVTFLYRASGSPAVSGNSMFGDVDARAYYADAVSWAVDEGITAGTGGNQFSPDAICTRAQIVTFLYRCLSNG